MDNIISKISEIESAASSIMDSANDQKQILAKNMEAKTTAFDEALEKETSQALNRLRSGIEQEMEKQLHIEKAKAENLMSQLQALYDEHHTQYVQQLFEAMVKE